MVFILLLLLETTAFTGSQQEGDTEDVAYTIKIGITYSNPVNGTGIWNFTEEERTIGLFMNNTWQTVYLLNHTYPFETTKVDENGNPISVLAFPITELKPGENVSFAVTYYVVSKPRSIPIIIENESGTLKSIPGDLIKSHCELERPWLADESGLRELAHTIAGNETRVLTIVKKFVAWIRDNIQYKYHEGYLYPAETYTKHQGACADQATLLITLCRIYGIPAYLQIGCIHLPERQTNATYYGGHREESSKQIGWHGWAIVYVPPWGWLPVDLTYVKGSLTNPINAITKGAVTFQRTIQYLNFTQTDYVASAREDRSFLMNNNFYVYSQDEMTLEPGPEPPHPPDPPDAPPNEFRRNPPTISTLMVIAAVGITLTGVSMTLLIIHVLKRKEKK